MTVTSMRFTVGLVASMADDAFLSICVMNVVSGAAISGIIASHTELLRLFMVRSRGSGGRSEDR